MFDISFGQLLLVLIIGLVVLGPERLPVAIKTVAGWIKVLRRMSASVQLELNKELKLQEIQESLRKVEQSSINAISPEIEAAVADLKRVAISLQKEIETTIGNIENNSIESHSVENNDIHPPKIKKNND